MTRHAISPLFENVCQEGIVQVIDDVPVGYKDLVKVWFMMRRALEMVRYSMYMSPHSAPDDMERRSLLAVAKYLETPGKLGPGITGWLLSTEEVWGILVATWVESNCRLFRPEATLRER